MSKQRCLLLGLFLLLLASSTPLVAQSDAQRTENAPLAQWFEPNVGQSDPQFRFISRDSRYMLFLGSAEIALSLLQREEGAQRDEGRLTFVNVHMYIEGGNPEAELVGDEPLPGVSNYLRGDSAWTSIPHYGRVLYRRVYPSIDLALRRDEGQVQYDFIVAPGGDPTQIRLRFAGIRSLEIAPSGDLIVHAPHNNTIRQRAPYSSQPGASGQSRVASRFVLLDKQSVGFAVEGYDQSRALVIDPTLIFSTYIGSAQGAETSIGIDLDSAGNAYIMGQAQAPGFPTTPGALDETFEGFTDTFVTKISADGTTLIYSTYLGGSDQETGHGIAVDAAGSAHVTGWSSSPDFPLTPSAYQTATSAGVFVTRLNAAGNGILYSTRLGGSGGEDVEGIALDAAGNIYITGYTTNTFANYAAE